MNDLPPRISLGIGLGVMSQLFQSRVAEILAPAEATYTQLSVLSHLARQHDPQAISDLAAAMQINQPGITKVVRRLEHAGLVEVIGSDVDKRRRLVSISSAGRERLGEWMAAVDSDLRKWFGDWSDDDVAAFSGYAWRLAETLDRRRLGST